MCWYWTKPGYTFLQKQLSHVCPWLLIIKGQVCVNMLKDMYILRQILIGVLRLNMFCWNLIRCSNWNVCGLRPLGFWLIYEYNLWLVWWKLAPGSTLSSGLTCKFVGWPVTLPQYKSKVQNGRNTLLGHESYKCAYSIFNKQQWHCLQLWGDYEF